MSRRRIAANFTLEPNFSMSLKTQIGGGAEFSTASGGLAYQSKTGLVYLEHAYTGGPLR